MRTAANSLTEADILAALRDVYDPEIRGNIVDLGLVHSVAITPDHDAPGAAIPGVPPRFRVTVNLTPPYPGSDSQAQITALVGNRLAAFPTISRTHVEPLTEPRWSPDRVSPELRQRLSLAVASNQRPNALVQIQPARAKERKDI